MSKVWMDAAGRKYTAETAKSTADSEVLVPSEILIKVLEEAGKPLQQGEIDSLCESYSDRKKEEDEKAVIAESEAKARSDSDKAAADAKFVADKKATSVSVVNMNLNYNPKDAPGV